jgi:transcriptional regulator with XRE-family HTH domain
MITNERQARVTRAAIKRLEEDLRALDIESGGLPPAIVAARRAGVVDQVRALREEVRAYHALKTEPRQQFVAESFNDLAGVLIAARVAAGLTQDDLARRLGLKRQQVQRYEQTGYASASLARIGRVLEALDCQIQMTAVRAHRPEATKPVTSSEQRATSNEGVRAHRPEATKPGRAPEASAAASHAEPRHRRAARA